jgi:DNA (cytosine-5)-methyltransferase 1
MAHLYRWEFVNGNQPRAAHRGPHEPAPTIAFGHNAERVEWVLRSGQSVAGGERAVWRSDEPSVTVTQNVDDCRWVVERPATTVQADPRIGRPGHKDRSSDGEPQFARESVRVSIEEAAILQGFRLDYPFQGTKTKRFEQVGNAVPPPMAAAVVGALTGIVAESLGAALP